MTNKEIVRQFLLTVRGGRSPDQASEFMGITVKAHQVESEQSTTVDRTPADYASHVREMLATYGTFRFEIEALVAEEDLVYARWRQTGAHLAVLDGFAPTGKPVVEVASATYRLEGGRIVEYWIQIDREGLRRQLEGDRVIVAGRPPEDQLR